MLDISIEHLLSLIQYGELSAIIMISPTDIRRLREHREAYKNAMVDTVDNSSNGTGRS